MKGVMWIFLWFLIGTVVLGRIVQITNIHCTPLRVGHEQSVKKADSTAASRQQTQSGAKNNKVVLQQVQSTVTEQQAERGGKEYHSWLDGFICEANATDYAIAFFTYCLVIVGMFTMWGAESLARSTERAHIFPKITVGEDDDDIIVSIIPENSGRSAGIMRAVYGEFSTYLPPLWKRYFVKGNVQSFDFVIDAGSAYRDPIQFRTPKDKAEFFRARILYVDLFGDRHHTYLCIRPNQNGYTFVPSKWRNRFN